MRERVGVGIYSRWVEEESGKGPYGREGWVGIYSIWWRENQGKGRMGEGWGDDIQYIGGGRIRERAIWERGLG